MRSLVLVVLVSTIAIMSLRSGNEQTAPRDENDLEDSTSAQPSIPLRALSEFSAEIDAPRRLIAPQNTLEGATLAVAGLSLLPIGAGARWGPAVRVDADASEHTGFHLAVLPATAEVEMEVLAWDGREALSLGMTNWGPGLRVLAVFDPFGPRTFWVRARGTIAEGELTIASTSIEGGPLCRADCEELLQLPLPIDAVAQGYEIAPSSVFAYHFGRRDLLMALFHAGSLMADAGVPPFQVKRLSRWDGGQPPSHRSHRGGVDVDISLYTAAGERVWYPLCGDAGQRCIRATRWDFGGEQMALLIAGFFATGLFEAGGAAKVLLDREYHSAVRAGADALYDREVISTETYDLFSHRHGLLRHVEPHHHHVHLRVGAPPPLD